MAISFSAETLRLLRGRNYAVLATINPDGSPHTSTMWVGLDGDDLLFSTLEGRVKHRNMLRDPRVSVTVWDSADPEISVDLRGRVSMTPDPGRLLDIQLSHKYDGTDPGPDAPGRHRVIVRMTVEKAAGHAAQPVITYEWRGPFDGREVSALHAEAFGGQGGSGGAGDRGAGPRDWRAQVERHSLGWVCARDGGDLAGFVNVAWDGGVHAFILDTMVAAGLRQRGIGAALIAVAVREARRAGCEWLHVDFEEYLHPFYVNGCGFTPSSAGLLAL